MTRSFTFALLLVVCFVLVGSVAAQDAPTPEPVGLRPDAPQYALHGPYWVGTQEFGVRDVPTGLRFWYPALKPDRVTEWVAYEVVPDYPGTPIVLGHALDGAEPDPEQGPYPLAVFLHGTGDYRLEMAYLAEHLASYGFVVMAADYRDWIFSDDSLGEVPAGLYGRPMLTTALIDYAQTLPSLNGMIDTEQVVILGHSLGADNAMSLAGAQLNMDWYAEIEATHPEICTTEQWGNYCAYVLAHQQDIARVAGLDAIPDGLWPAPADPRVDAIVGYAPSLSFFGAEGLQDVTVPALVMFGTADTYVNADVEMRPVYDNLPSAQKAMVALGGASHHIFRDDCTATPWLYDEYGAFWACSDFVWDMDRAHDLINHFTTAFLLSTLKGDAEAAAALAPDAVSFPGIEYQAEGY